ncbi:MAG TPA: hypothetical protein VK835_11255 [Bacteroidia bacterium]|jgi:DNA-binding NtrC family response regulator|nr:hypothetical protein [Bacteroidia bacterium]
MKKDGIILIIEPERIIGLELQVELEHHGYTVLQSPTIKLAQQLNNKQKVKVIIIDVDKTPVADFIQITKHFKPSQYSVIAITSGAQALKEYQDIKFIEVFLKPFNSKNIASFIDKQFAVLNTNSV